MEYSLQAAAAAARIEKERERNKRLAAEIEVLTNVRRRQDQEAADMLMQLAGSSRQLTFVQKDLVRPGSRARAAGRRRVKEPGHRQKSPINTLNRCLLMRWCAGAAGAPASGVER